VLVASLSACTTTGEVPDPDAPTRAGPGSDGDFTWDDAVLCEQPHDGWAGRFTEEGAQRGLTRELSGMPDGPVFRGVGSVAVSDLDLDGDLDLVFGHVPMPPFAYLNDGAGFFEPGPELQLPPGSPFLPAPFLSVVDVDDDPYPEVMNLGEALVVWDDLGDGSFGVPSILPLPPSSMRAALTVADVDGDGDVDALAATFKLPGQDTDAFPELLIENDGGFEEIREIASATGGVHGQAALFTDRDFDGDPDLLVVDGDANAQHPSAFFTNDGGGLGVDDAAEIGAAITLHGMGVASWDWNDDGLLDYCMTDVGDSVCLLSDGAGYVNGASAVGLAPSENAFPDYGISTIGWSLDVVDLNHDGHLDAVQASAPDHGSELPPEWLRWPDLLWAGESGEAFEDVTEDSGFGTDDANFGLAAADFDGDGAQDLIVVGPGLAPRLYMNRCSDGWIELDLLGAPGNADAIGAIAWVDEVPRELYGPRTYGQRASRLHFGLGHSEAVAVRVLWPDGHVSEAAAVPADRLVTIHHPDAD